MFITFEGGEGSGKSTQMERLSASLKKKGYDVVVSREPGGTPLGEHIRETLLNPNFGVAFGSRAELMLFLASRVEHLEKVIFPALSRGKIVLCDRFNDSTIAYQGFARGLGMEEVEALCNLACRGVIPDLTFLLDLEPQKGMERLNREPDRLEKKGQTFHQKVREAFLRLAAQHSLRIHKIDASQSEDEVASEILKVAKNVI